MNISARLQENVLRALLSVMIDFSVEISLMSQLINVVCSSSTFTSSKTHHINHIIMSMLHLIVMVYSF